MKKLFFTLLVFMTLITTAKADPFRFGITAGMNITKGKVSDKAGWSPDTENGWFAGVQLKVTIPIIGLGMDGSLIYSQEKVSLAEDKKETLDYLAVPLHLRYDLDIPAINKVFVPFIFTGPQAGLTLSKIDKSYQEKITTKDIVWRYDLGFGMILLNHLQAAYSYSFPLSETYEGSLKSQADQFDNDYKQGVHRISLTYFF